MFGKQIVEVCTIAAYWVLFVPLLLVWLNIKINNSPFDYFFAHSDMALYLIMGYLGLYRIVLYLFIKLQSFDLGLWHTLTKTKAECEMQLEEAKWKSRYKNFDEVDGPPATISYSTRIPRKRAPPTPMPSRSLTPTLSRPTPARTPTLSRPTSLTLSRTPPPTPPRTPFPSPTKSAPPLPTFSPFSPMTELPPPPPLLPFSD